MSIVDNRTQQIIDALAEAGYISDANTINPERFEQMAAIVRPHVEAVRATQRNFDLLERISNG